MTEHYIARLESDKKRLEDHIDHLKVEMVNDRHRQITQTIELALMLGTAVAVVALIAGTFVLCDDSFLREIGNIVFRTVFQR